MTFHQTIREKYHSMPDEALKKLALYEIDELTDEAKELLFDEIRKRKIILTASKDDTDLDHTMINFSNIEKHVIQFISEQKIKKESDAYIIGGLIERGFDETLATEITAAFPVYLKERKNKMSQTILTGILQFVSGLAIIELPLRKESQLAVIIIGYSLLILGMFRIFHGIMNKLKIDKMLNYPPSS